MSDKITPELLQSITDAITSSSQSNHQPLLQQISISSFGDSDKENIYTFIDNFEASTTQLADEQKLAIIPRFLTGGAKIWYEIEKVKKKQPKKWKELKDKLLNRFGGKGAVEHHIQTLRTLKFNEGTKKISDHVEKFIYHYQRAYPVSDEEELVKEIHRNLPTHIRADINKF